jgi:hypothetical protein
MVVATWASAGAAQEAPPRIAATAIETFEFMNDSPARPRDHKMHPAFSAKLLCNDNGRVQPSD